MGVIGNILFFIPAMAQGGAIRYYWEDATEVGENTNAILASVVGVVNTVSWPVVAFLLV